MSAIETREADRIAQRFVEDGKLTKEEIETARKVVFEFLLHLKASSFQAEATRWLHRSLGDIKFHMGDDEGDAS